jgi:hypothetical protein
VTVRWTCPECLMLIQLHHVTTTYHDGVQTLDLHGAIGLHLENCG